MVAAGRGLASATRQSDTGHGSRWATSEERVTLQQQADQLYRGGLSQCETATKLGWSRSFVRRLLAAAKTPMRSGGRHRKYPAITELTAAARTQLAKHAGHLYQTNMPIKTVAAQIGRSRDETRALIIEAGVNIRARKGRQPGRDQAMDFPPGPYEAHRRQTSLRLL